MLIVLGENPRRMCRDWELSRQCSIEGGRTGEEEISGRGRAAPKGDCDRKQLVEPFEFDKARQSFGMG